MQPRSGRHRGPHTVAIALALVGTSLLIPAVAAEATDPAVQEANASSGGSASTTADGTIEIGEIVTGENTGNSILAGDITGAAAFDGGVIDSPTEVTVTQVIAPSIATASGGDEGQASIAPEDGGDTDEDLTIINRNDNRSSATVTLTGAG